MYMSLKLKFRLLGALTVGLMLILAIFAALQLRGLQSKEEQRQAATDELDATALHILSANVDFKTQIQQWKNILLRGNNLTDFNTHKSAFLSREQQVKQALEAAAKERYETPSAQIEIEALLTAHTQLGEQYKKLLQQFDPKDALSGHKLDSQIRGIDQALSDALQGKVDSLEQRARELRKLDDTTTAKELRQAKIIFSLVSLACILILITLMFFILRSVLSQIGGDPQEAMLVAKNVAQGNLAAPISQALPNSVLSHLQDMVYGLSDLIDDIHQACTQLNKIALSVDSASNQLAKNSVEQVKVVEIHSSALEQISVTVEKNAEHSKQLARLINTTPEAADLITEINCASKEQAAAIADSSKNLFKLSQRTHENALQAQKLSQAANVLYGQTRQLSELINVFKTA